MVMSGRSFVYLVCCFMSMVNSYGHVWTIICLLDVSLYVHGKQQWSCLDSHLFFMCCFTSTVNRNGHVWTVICLFDVLLYVHGKHLWSCLDGHLFV